MSNSKLPFLFPLLLLGCLLFGSCLREPSYPRLLVEADSAMRWGHYDEADSLLSAYNKAKDNENLSTHRYHQLLQLESKFLLRNLKIDNLLLADSLCSYYKRVSAPKHTITLAILGDIYCVNSDYPTALDYFLQAEKEAKEEKMLWLQSILNREIGDIYLDQRMFSEMAKFFLRSYHLSLLDKDTLRMANAAIRMGKVHTYLQNVDSVVIYYQKAIELGRSLKNGNVIVQAALFDLADIYLQTEEFDKAASIMPRDTMNDVNWAYWHYQQNHVDSAIYYFQKSLFRYNYFADAEYLSLLSDLEEKKSNYRQSINYYKQCVEAKDSFIVQSQREATLNAAAQYNLNFIKKKLERAERNGNYWKWGLTGVISLVFLAVFYGRREWKRHQQDEATAIAREQQLRQEAERKHRQSRQQIEENNQHIQQLEQQLDEARKQNDQLTIQKLKLDTEQLRAENANIEATNERKEYLLREFQESLIYQRIMINAGKQKFHLRDEEWDTLAEWIDKVHDNFTTRLMALTPLNITERQICYLVKLNLKPSQIAAMLNITDTAISMNRNRLYKKIFHEKGSAKDFDEFIKNF